MSSYGFVKLIEVFIGYYFKESEGYVGPMLRISQARDSDDESPMRDAVFYL